MIPIIFQHRDGELRIIEHGKSGVTYYAEILFCDANLSAPIGRNFSTERIILDRGVFDANAHYVQSGDADRFEPLSLTFSGKLYDKSRAMILTQLLSGVTRYITVGGSSYCMHTRAGRGMYIFGLSKTIRPPQFNDTAKVAYMVEVLYSGTSSYGFRWDDVYFQPAEQTITEAEDSVTININAKVYGGVTRITTLAGTNSMGG